MFADLEDPYVLNILALGGLDVPLTPFGKQGIFRPASESHAPCLWRIDARTNQGEGRARSNPPGSNTPNAHLPDALSEAASARPKAQKNKWRILNCWPHWNRYRRSCVYTRPHLDV